MIQTQAPINNLYIGIMSGTSVDAIDTVSYTHLTLPTILLV